MEQNQNLPVIAKRFWSIVRVMYFMLRKGISKRKLMLDLNLNLIFKRGKLIFHHHNTTGSAPSREYEFSCSNTPNYTFFNKKRNNFFACTHAPSVTHDDDAATVKAVIEMLNGYTDDGLVGLASPSPSPYLPGFGRTPLARQLRITDSPFPLKEEGGEDNGRVDKAAEEFIKKFYKDLKQQKKKMMFDYSD